MGMWGQGCLLPRSPFSCLWLPNLLSPPPFFLLFFLLHVNMEVLPRVTKNNNMW